jgi:membrane-bound lytic murein transglycosylase D
MIRNQLIHKGWEKIDIPPELRYSFGPMFPTIKMKYALALAGLFLQALPAHAEESTQSLLAELSRPSALQPSTAEEPSLLSPVDRVDEETPAPASELFTLEEIKGKASGSAELELPDIDLPLSDIPLTLNSKVQYFLYYFQTKGKPSFSRWLSRSSRYIPMMKAILKSKGMPEDLVYVAMIESGFHLQACSWANAVGPWQFISDTGRRYALRIDQWVDERKDPVKATTAAALYLKELYGLFNGDWYLAAAGYNAGENKILRAINMYNTNDFWELTRGSYLKRETKEYVPKLLAAAIIAKEPARYGFSDIAYLPPIEFDTVTISSRTDLALVARLSGTTYETIKELNPDLRHWCTPPNYPGFMLKLPKGTKHKFEAELAKIPIDQRFTEKLLYTRYQARRNDSIASVARRFNVAPEDLTQLNGLSKGSHVSGRSLIVPAKQTVDFGREGRTAPPVSASKIVTNGTYAKYHVVKKGDTLESIARKFNVSAKLLSAWNNLKGKIALKPGRRIIVALFTEKNGEMVPTGSKG